MGDSRGEGERNFWNGKEAVTSMRPKPLNELEVKSLRGEGGSDVFTTDRHVMHDPVAQRGFKINFWSGDDSPVIRPVVPQRPYTSATVPLDGYGGDGCERVTKLYGRTNLQMFKSVFAIAGSGIAAFALILYLKGGKPKKT